MLDKKTCFYCGIDTHKSFHQAVLVNRFEEEIATFRIENRKEGIQRFVKELKGVVQGRKVVFGIEGGFHLGSHLSSVLVERFPWVYEVNSIYTKEKRFCDTDWSKTDLRDAKLIASILIRKIDSLPLMSREHTHNKVFVKLRNILDLWDDVALELARSKNQLHHLLYQKDPEYQKKYPDLTGKKVLGRLIKDFSQKEDILSQHILWKARRIKELKKKKKDLFLVIQNELSLLDFQLETLEGVGPVNALAIISLTCGGRKFRNINQFKRYVGCIPERNESGTKRKERTSKMKQKRLYKAMYSIALTQIRKNPKARAYYEKKLKEGKTKKQARRALINRLSSIVYGMLRTKGQYQG